MRPRPAYIRPRRGPGRAKVNIAKLQIIRPSRGGDVLPAFPGDVLVRESRTQFGERCLNAVVLALSAPATTAARAVLRGGGRLCGRLWELQNQFRDGELHSGHLTRRLVLDWQRSAPRFHAALSNSRAICCTCAGSTDGAGGVFDDATASGAIFRDWPVVSSSQRSSSRNHFAWPPVTSQIRGRVAQLPASLHRHKIARPRYQRHQYGWRPVTGEPSRTSPFISFSIATTIINSLALQSVVVEVGRRFRVKVIPLHWLILLRIVRLKACPL